MAAATARELIEGAAGKIECASTVPDSPRAVAVIAHPHPLFGGTMDNKVVTTLTRAFVESGAATFRLNFRGVGATEGEGVGVAPTRGVLATRGDEAGAGVVSASTPAMLELATDVGRRATLAAAARLRSEGFGAPAAATRLLELRASILGA